jgi:uncharacterized repeat protein (TIGR01451 family)
MRSRGFLFTLGVNARKSLALLGAALILCSVLLQYVAIAAPATALAVHDTGTFELEGNAVDQGTPGDDWENGTPGAQDDLFIPGSVEKDGPDATYFQGGGSKDEHALSAWGWSSNDVAPDKDELLDVFAAVYQPGDDTVVYFGADKFDDSGDAQIGFWFFRSNVSLDNDGSFNGSHAVGDVLVLSDFTNGGNIDRICVYEWDPPGGTAAINNSAECDLGDNLVLVASGADCSVGDGANDVCAVVNADAESAPWAFENKDGDPDFGPGQFYEGGLNLSELFGGQPPCFNSFLAETRSSQETDAQLKDFALGSLDTCVPPDLTTEASMHDADFGDSVTDTATLSGSNGPVTGTVEFFLCGPSGSYPDCDNGGTQIGGAVEVTGGSATSAPYEVGLTAAAVGKYCFRAEYTPDAGSPYLATEHTNKSSECFKVDPATIEIVKTANPEGPVDAGDAIGFDIVVTNTGTTTTLGVHVTDSLPAGVTWTADAPTGSTTNLVCQVTGSPGSQELDCTKPSLAAGASFTVHVHGTTDAADCDEVSNTARVGTSNDGSDSDGATVGVLCPEVEIAKTADDASVNAGEPIGFTITITNNGEGAAKDVSASDTLDPDFDWEIETPVDGWTLTGNELSFSAATFAAGATSEVHLVADTDPEDCRVVPNSAGVTWSNEGSDDASASTEILCPDVHVQKTGNGPLNAGDVASFTITVSNDGVGLAKNVVLTDVLPAGIVWTLDPDNQACDIAAGTLTCNFGDLAKGESASVTVSGETAFESCPEIINLASATAGNESEADAADNEDSTRVMVECPEIGIIKTAEAPIVNATDTVAFTIELANNQSGTAYGLEVTDTLPANPGLDWAIVPANPDWIIDGGVLKYLPTTLAGNTTVSVRIESPTTPATCGRVDNTVLFDTSNDGSGSGSSSIEVLCPDVVIRKLAVETPILAGGTATFAIQVWNGGPGVAYDVVITDLLPAGFEWTADNEACEIAEGVLTCNVGDLDDETTFNVTLSAPTTVQACGTIHNAASVDADNEPGGTGNNEASAEIDVLCASIDLVKTAGEAPNGVDLLLEEPGDVEFTYVVTNTGTADLQDVILVDDNATPDDESDDVTVECPGTLEAGTWMVCTATLPVDVGRRTNVAVVTAHPVIEPEAEVSDTDDAVVVVPEPEETPTPSGSVKQLTPPATSTVDEGPRTTPGSGLLLVLAGLATLVLTAGYLVPARARADRRHRR